MNFRCERIPFSEVPQAAKWGPPEKPNRCKTLSNPEHLSKMLPSSLYPLLPILLKIDRDKPSAGKDAGNLVPSLKSPLLCPISMYMKLQDGLSCRIKLSSPQLTSRHMTSNKSNISTILAHEKLEWVDPQILLMGAEETAGKFPFAEERTAGVGAGWGGPGSVAGPS